MDFRRIQHFVHTAELGSISKASDRLNIVQPALSQSLRRLEEELGVALLLRSRRGTQLTEAGAIFLQHAYGILNQYNKAKESVAGIGQAPAGHVSMALTASALNVLALPLTECLTRLYPDITISLEEGLAADIQRGLDAGSYDLVISYMVEPGPSMVSEPLIEEELFLAGAIGSDLPDRELTLQDLGDLPLIIPQDHHGVRMAIHEAASSIGVSIRPHQVRAALHPTLQLVEHGLGYSLIPWSAIFDRVEQKRIVGREIASSTLSQSVSMVHPAHKPLTPATIAVMNLVRQSAVMAHKTGKWRGRLAASISREDRPT
jgi:LysR family transcriptional regulator, nitrogen assimilation regulatory protein